MSRGLGTSVCDPATCALLLELDGTLVDIASDPQGALERGSLQEFLTASQGGLKRTTRVAEQNATRLELVVLRGNWDRTPHYSRKQIRRRPCRWHN